MGTMVLLFVQPRRRRRKESSPSAETCYRRPSLLPKQTFLPHRRGLPPPKRPAELLPKLEVGRNMSIFGDIFWPARKARSRKEIIDNLPTREVRSRNQVHAVNFEALVQPDQAVRKTSLNLHQVPLTTGTIPQPRATAEVLESFPPW